MSLDAIIGAIIALSSGLAGAFFQAVLSRRSEYIKSGRQARYDAYADYFKGIAQISHLTGDQDKASALALIANARGRIALYGSPAVVSAMCRVFDNGSDITSPNSRDGLASMLAAMRADVLWIDPKADGDQLLSIVFGRGAQSQ